MVYFNDAFSSFEIVIHYIINYIEMVPNYKSNNIDSIIVIYYEEILLSLIQIYYKKMGYDVTVFNNPLLALQYTSNNKDRFDLTIIDYKQQIRQLEWPYKNIEFILKTEYIFN